MSLVMLHALRIGLLAACLVFFHKAHAEELVFLSVLEDVPLMSGLSEQTDDTIYFDTPGGRIVEAYAVGTVTKESILTYYKESLASLGWNRTAHGTYVRENEFLSISVKMEGANAIVRFALSPDGK